MPSTVFPRVGIVDFFGTLPGGYVLLYSLLHFEDARSLRDSLTLLTGQDRAILVVGYVGVAYVLGSFLRAAPVGWLERWAWIQEKGIFKWIPARFRTTRFPFPDRIRYALLNFAHSSHKIGAANPSMLIFDYWKAVICRESPNLFGHVKTLEAKTRFFVGLIYACLISLMVFCFTEKWNMLLVDLLLLPPLMYALLRARREEASEVLWAYLACLKVEPSTRCRSSGYPS